MTARATGDDIKQPLPTEPPATVAPSPDGRAAAQQKPGQKKPPAPPTGVDSGASPLDLDGWLEFNRVKWGVRPQRIRLPEAEGTRGSIEGVVYLDQRGKIVNPPRNSYLPVRFHSTPTILPYRVMHQWLEVSRLLADDMRQRGLKNTINLPPNVTDIRPWQWAGFRANVRYTMVIEFPFNLQATDKSLGRIQRKTEREGFRCDRTTNMHDVAACLADTERRQGFSLGLSVADLELAQSLLGEDAFRTHMCYAPNGEPASATVALHQPGTPAIGWVGGTRNEYLRAGPAQLLEFFAIDDLTEAGASEYDLCGANIPSVAYAKAAWGASLRPYYAIEAYDLRRLAKWSKGWWEYLQQGRPD